MPKFILTILMTMICVMATSQESDSLSARQIDASLLADYAWENSRIRHMFQNDSDLALSELRSSRFRWLDGLTVGSNINEFTLNPPENRNNFFPRYNFGFGLSFGQIIRNSTDVKKAKVEIERITFQRKEDSVKLRSEVMRRYESYKMTEELFRMANESVINLNSELSQVEQEFTEGTIDLASYNQVLGQYNNAKSAEIRAEHNYVLSKINLEELLGITIEQAFQIMRSD